MQKVLPLEREKVYKFDYLYGITVDDQGNLYVADGVMIKYEKLPSCIIYESGTDDGILDKVEIIMEAKLVQEKDFAANTLTKE